MTDQREFEKLEESSCSSVRHLPYVATDKPVMYLAVKCHGSNKTAPARSLLRSMFSPCSPPTINRLAKRDRSLWSKCRTITLWKFYLHSRVADFSWRCKFTEWSWLHLKIVWRVLYSSYILFCMRVTFVLYMRNSVQFSTWKCENELFEV